MHSEAEVLSGLRLGEQLRPMTAFAGAAFVMLAAIAIFAPTARSMIEIYARSDTFAHGFLVLPATLWFIWHQRNELARTPVQPFWPGLVAILGAAFLWLVAELSGSLAPAQFALVALAVSSVVTVFGLRWARVLVFPLGFLFFAVPFGDAFVPVLIEWTADFTVLALLASGVPVLREGNDLTIPSGRWSVVEACSGVRYLLASVMAGVLFAWMMYNAPIKRGLFIAASILVPIVANWLRAYMIVMLGHLSGNTIAVGVDHLLYGWVFFGLVIFVMFWVGARWRDPPSDSSDRLLPGAGAGERAVLTRAAPVTVAALALLLTAPVARAALIDAGDKRAVVVSPIAAAAGWAPANAPVSRWQPVLEQPRARHEQTFEKDGARVTVTLGIYRDQRQGSELVSWSNQMIGGTRSDWLRLSRSAARVSSAGRSFEAESGVLRSHDQQIAVLRWYWTADVSTASDSRAKIDLAFDRLLRRDDTSAWLAISTPSDPLNPHGAIAVLQRFAAEMGDEVDAALRRTAAR